MSELRGQSGSRFRLPRRMRLCSPREFTAVYASGVRINIGPLHAVAKRNGLGHWRLGLSVSRRVGGAVKRNRVKRLLRESFRLQQHSMPGAYDLVVSVRPGEVPTLEDCHRLLLEAARRLHEKWIKRRLPTRPDLNDQ